MKKAGTLITLLILLCLSTFAQRHADLQVIDYSPANGQIVPPLQSFDSKVTIKNLGADTIRPTDSMALYMLVNNDTFLVAVNGHIGKYRLYTGQTLAMGDTMPVTFPMTFDTSFRGMTINFCWVISILPHTSDPIVDLNASNDRSCAMITIKDLPNAVTLVNSETNIRVYPNPATNIVNFQVPQGHTSIQVYNAVGQLVAQKEQNNTTLVHVNTSSLPNGIYYYKFLGSQGATTTGRFLIGK